ncbi:hypothetical protein BDE36_2221 [Arcticibacter tournemirensis]|uniref:Uncharacterized protein n=1 Tax=Arcticibacter tournemirensis TaxID=699437 RepID=A0A5M9HFC2_9SPHI|nr:hypothetical protein [Arcticibacter tournemirensis]KAA8485065.1 hypothetical protein F1649_05385 [Arcticibacter tournemirensis]TQM50475.1 hypothetical protein BDE36_2221 [Arcticibacter tournemirensis]
MIGFEVKINNDIPIKIASQSSQLFLTVIESNVLLLISGTDLSGNRVKWPNQILKSGDKVNIKVKDIQCIDEPSEIKEQNIDYIKERYLDLKAELENKGLI